MQRGVYEEGRAVQGNPSAFKTLPGNPLELEGLAGEAEEEVVVPGIVLAAAAAEAGNWRE